MANQPIKTFRNWGVSLACWGSTSGKGLNWKASKNYKNQQGEWQTTDYMSSQDLALLAVLIPIATGFEMEYLAKARQRDASHVETNTPPPQQELPQGYDDDDIPF